MLIAFNKTDFFNKLFPEVDTNNDEAVKQKLSDFYHPKRIQIKLEGEKIFVQFLEIWEENKPEDFFKATTLCTNKRYHEAIPIFHKLIQENPTDSEYYRNLAQAYEESGEYEKAIDHLIDALRWDPTNHWALLLMGNIYIKYLNDLQTATTYFEQVLEVDAKNHLVLSNIGGLFLKASKSKLAERFFNRALESNPKFPNALHGKALLENERGNILKSFELGIDALRNADQEDLRNVLLGFVTNIASRYVKEEICKNRVNDYINELKEYAKTDIQLGEDPTIPVEAKLEMAEIYGRKHHKVLYKNETPLLPHLIAHELTHLKYFEDAKRADCYYHFTSGADEKSRFTKLMDSSIAKLQRKGLPNERILGFVDMVFHGTNSRIFNAPIDLFIEDYIYNSLPELKPYQFLSLINLDKVSLQAVTDMAILEVTPQKIVSKVKVYNAVSARHCDSLYGIRTEKEYPLSPTEKKQVDAFWEEFNEYRNDKKPGEEYELIQHWAEDLELDNFFKLKKVAQEDSIQKEKASINSNNGMTEDEKEKLNRILESESLKNVDRMLLSLLVSAYKTLKYKSLDEIEGIAFELGMKAKSGISADQKDIQVDCLPNQFFDGQELLAWYYTSWAIYKPEFIHELGLPYQTEFELAKRVVESTNT